MTHNELKAKIKDSMVAYLKPYGYPDRLTNEEIIKSHLPGLWKKLEKEKLLESLVKEGLTYGVFVNIAVRKFQEADILEKMTNGFGFRF